MSILEVGAAMNAIVQRKLPWSRDDTVIHLTTEPLIGSPQTAAWYHRNLADIYVNVERVLGEGFDEAWLYGGSIQKLLWGFVTHEALHSVYSHFHILAPKPVAATLMMFEELRIEKHGVDHGAVDHLRQSFGWILGEYLKHPEDLPTDPWSIAHAWAITYGRSMAGIAQVNEVASVDLLARVELGDDTVDLLKEILSEAMTLNIPREDSELAYVRDERLETLRLLAVEWLETLGVDPDEATLPRIVVLVECGEQVAAEAAAKAEAEAAAKAEAEGGDDGEFEPGLGELDSAEATDEDTPGDAPYKEIDAETSALLRKALEETAESATKPIPVVPTPVDTSEPHKWAKVFRSTKELSSAWVVRPPTPEQRGKATRLARTLESLSLPTIAKTRVRSHAPPGRLRGRAAVRQASERARHVPITAEPWERTLRRRTHTRPVIVGVMTDVSGSMMWAQEFVGEFAWVTGTAGVHIGARVAGVTFGDSVEAVIHPGEVPRMVKIREADGGSEAFDHAAAAIESQLMLSAQTPYAKVLFIVSDGQLVREREPERAFRWIERWTKGGTLIIWVAGTYHMDYYRKAVRRPGVLHVVDIPIDDRTYDDELTVPGTERLYANLSREVMAAASRVV